MVDRFTEHASRVMDLAGEEAALLGHRYVGPEHLVLGLLRDGGNDAARVLRAHGVDLAAARVALRSLAERGVVPAPRPSDAELLGMLGVDLDAVRRSSEQAFGSKALGEATWRVTHFWDAGNVVGAPFLERFGVDPGGLDYDFFLLFDRDASWGTSPPRPVSSGATVIGDSGRLADSAASLLR